MGVAWLALMWGRVKRAQARYVELLNSRAKVTDELERVLVEISDNDDSVERSLQEWKRLMHKLGVVNFNDDGVRKLLNTTV